MFAMITVRLQDCATNQNHVPWNVNHNSCELVLQ